MENLNVLKIFAIVSPSYVKLKKHDGDVAAALVRVIVLKLCPNFMQKRAQSLQKRSHLNFDNKVQFGDHKNPQDRRTVSSKSNKFDKLTKVNALTLVRAFHFAQFGCFQNFS